MDEKKKKNKKKKSYRYSYGENVLELNGKLTEESEKKLVPISSRRKNMGLVIQTFTQNILFSRAFCFPPIPFLSFFKSNIKINTREK